MSSLRLRVFTSVITYFYVQFFLLLMSFIPNMVVDVFQKDKDGYKCTDLYV